jgi:protein kinase-like protein/FHA domain-containing protein
VSAFRLVVERGRSKGRYFRLKPNQSATLGREAKNDLAIQDPQASRAHCRIEGKLGEFVLTDLDSSNGTFVNGERQERVTLSAGDRISLGESLVCFLPETDEDRSARRGPLSDREIQGYRVGRVLGRGGMGTVYEAVQVSLERKVALKVLAPELTRDPNRVESFVAEARAAGRLNNAHLVGVYDVFEEEGQHLISMELMPSGSLEDLLRERGGPIPLAETLPLLFDAARGLTYAAEQGLVHRDVKPANLMLGENGVVKLCDLGLAIFTSRQHDVSGSPHYIAPEQALGEDLDGRADLYALGASWVELLSNDTLYSGTSAGDLARKQVEEPIPDLTAKIPDLPEEVGALLRSLLAKKPAERYPSARQLQRDLVVLARRYGSPELATRLGRLAPSLDPSPFLAVAAPEVEELPPVSAGDALRAWLPLVAVVVILATLAGGITWLVRSTERAAQERRSAAVTQLEALEERARTEPEKAEAEVGDVIDDLEQAGYPELLERARAVATGLVARRRQADLAEREVEAAEVVEQAAELCEDEVGPSPDPEVGLAEQRGRLEQALHLLNGVVKKHSDTKAGGEARALREKVLVALDRLEVEERNQRAKADLARKAFEALGGEVREALTRPKRGSYEKALAACRRYLEKHGSEGAKTGVALQAWVQKETETAVRGAIKRSRALVLRESWDEALAVLQPVWPPLGLPNLDAEVRQAASEIQAAQRASEAAAAQRVRQAAEAIVKRVQAEAAPLIGERRYGEAARKLRASLSRIQLPDLRRLTELRAGRLEGAQRTLDRLFAHVKEHKEPELWLDLQVAGKVRRAKATAVDTFRRRLTFSVTKQILRDVTLVTLGADELLALTKPLARSGATHLDQACLAYELSRSMYAEQHCQQARGLDPAQAQAVEGLRVLAGSGQ